MKEEHLLDAVLEKAQFFKDNGADLLDVGGESTRPGAQPVSLQQELDRVIPVIQLLHQKLEIPISVDTYKSAVAQAALSAGAEWINDVWGLNADPMMAEVAARQGVPVVIMHNHSKPSHAELQARLGGRYIGVPYENLINDVKTELLQSVEIAHQAGVQNQNIILDPGIGFGKTVEQNLELINRLDEIKALGYPLLLGVSRKSFIGYTLDLPPEERLEGTAARLLRGHPARGEHLAGTRCAGDDPDRPNDRCHPSSFQEEIMKKSRPEIFFAVFIFFIGLIFLLITPAGANYDEETYLARIWEMGLGHIMPNSYLNEGPNMPNGFLTISYRRQVNLPVIDMDTLKKQLEVKIDWDDFEKHQTRAVYFPTLFMIQALLMRYFGAPFTSSRPGALLHAAILLSFYLLSFGLFHNQGFTLR